MINVRLLLHDLDIQVAKVETKSDGDVEYYARCPHHLDADGNVKVDHSPSWSINGTTGAHHCFSCGFTGSAMWLIYKVTGCDFDEALEKAGKYRDSIVDVMEVSPWDPARPAGVHRLPINRARLMSYLPPPDSARQIRALTAEACEAYNVRYDEQAAAWITPIVAPDTFELWGWQMKGAEPGSRLFRNFPFGVRKSDTLFGIDAVLQTDTVWVVESPLDAVRLYGLGYPAVSTFGAKVSVAQYNMLCGFAGLIVAMDNDDAGIKASLGFLDYARRVPMKFFNYGDSPAKDVGDMTDEEILFGYENSRHALWGRQAVGL